MSTPIIWRREPPTAPPPSPPSMRENCRITPHSFGDVNCGNMYWNACNGPLTDAQWQTNMTAIDAWKPGNGGSRHHSFALPLVRGALLGPEQQHRLRSVESLRIPLRHLHSESPGFQSTLNNNGAERLPVRPYWNYEMPPKVVPDPEFPHGNISLLLRRRLHGQQPHRAAPQTFFLFGAQYFDTSKYSRPDFEWPSALATPVPTPTSSVGQLKQYTWRFWSGLAPVQLFTHDSQNYEASQLFRTGRR